ncbi:hypothetical protein [Asticcacaulis solisilvae]|uniref:hypothetical protein n=1 Tax=Asticcacaulis solisilvae TaxID=1217274 RepID=UPI003FD777E9
MTDDNETLHDNLAFVRALVSEGGRAQGSAGATFLAAGLCYGIQCLLQWAQVMGWLPYGILGLIVGVAPTVVFLAILCVVLWRDRKNRQEGVATRALNAAYGSAGLANLFMVAVFGYNAILEKSITVWLYYPVVVCAFQGAVWYIAYMIRRKLWLAGVSAGWFATTLALGFMIHQPQFYVLVLGLALLFVMGGSGYALMRSAQTRG